MAMRNLLACVPQIRLISAEPPASAPPAAQFREEMRFTSRDRILLLGWSDAAATRGLRKVSLNVPEQGDDPDSGGDFLMVYAQDAQWARWGVAPTAAGYIVWDTATGADLACCASLSQALTVLERPDA
jgi:hypothetical protein